jgi:hypothetical protein
MILMRILPGVLKELSKHVPTVLFQTVEWGELASELPKVSRRVIQKEGFLALYQHQQDFLLPFGINLTHDPVVKNIAQSKAAGEKILALYYAQLFSPEGVFLDLRPQHFENQKSFLWHPTGLWTKFDESFRLGLLNVYEGFYLEEDELYYQGLKAIGLIQEDWPVEDKKKLGDLFRGQFGEALKEEMSFSVEHLKDSIVKMSEFILKKKVKISKDFLYLGIYLVTLYSSLEEVHAKLPAREIFLETKKSLS